jgi:AcrR family transcriptional regulator
MADEPTAAPGWQERTVERSLKAARERAISRGDKFIGAAVDLLRTKGKPDFTVQEVVERSGMSLRSFYHHFATKDDLLLAVIEETIRRYVDGIRAEVAAAASPSDQLAVLLRRMFRGDESDDPASRGLVLFHWHLADTRTDEFAQTLQPQLQLIESIIRGGVEAGEFRTDLPVEAMAALVNATVLSMLEMRTLGVQLVSEPVGVDDLVAYCLAAVAVPGGPPKPSAASRPTPRKAAAKRAKRS